jgi:hypothetical protein
MTYLSGSVCGMLYGSGFSGEFHERVHGNTIIDENV